MATKRPALDLLGRSDRGASAPYAKGLDPAPRGTVAAVKADREWSDSSLWHTIGCNKMPRYSTAPMLDAVAARALGVSPYTAGRRPAPRVEAGCLLGGGDLERPSGAFARDVGLTRKKQVSALVPIGGGPGPLPIVPPVSPPGPGPVPPAPPVLPPGGLPPVVVVPPGGSPVPPVAPVPPGWVPPPAPGAGWTRPVAFNFTTNIAGGDVNSELRVYGPIASAFWIRSITITPIASLELEQYVDIFVTTDNDPGDIDPPNGSSIFQPIAGLAAMTAPDNERGLLIGTDSRTIDYPFLISATQQSIKVQTKRRGGALTMPRCNVLIVIEEIPYQLIPVVPRPPLPPVVLPPAPVPPSTPPGTPALPAGPYVGTARLVPAWQLAAAMLPGTDRAASNRSYLVWLRDPSDPNAATFRATLARIFSAYNVNSAAALVPYVAV